MMDPAFNDAALDMLQSNLRHAKLCCRSNGVLASGSESLRPKARREFWSNGKRKDIQHSITPILQHSNMLNPL
jgi:hypothetical protein